MLVVFAASFFGAFEITLPSKWSNAVDSKAEKTRRFAEHILNGIYIVIGVILMYRSYYRFLVGTSVHYW